MNSIDISRIRSIFQDNIPVKIISEEIYSVPEGTPAPEILRVMDKERFDLIGAKNAKGINIGYYMRSDIVGNLETLEPRPFIHDHIISDSASILTAFRLLSEYEFLFLLEENKISRLITRSDLDKIPVRLWLFGIISILEMQLKAIIALEYPNMEWKGMLKDKRIENAQKLYDEKAKHNEETELLQCLQFCDLKEIIIHTANLMMIFSDTFKSHELNHILNKIMDLRDYLAHAQKITNNFTIKQLQQTSTDIERLFTCISEG